MIFIEMYNIYFFLLKELWKKYWLSSSLPCVEVLEVSEEGEGGEVGTLDADYVVAFHHVAVLYTVQHKC